MDKGQFKNLKVELLAISSIENDNYRKNELLELIPQVVDVEELQAQELLKSNSKLSSDTVALNTDLGLLCKHGANNNCHLCKSCYAIRFEKMYKYKLLKSLKQVYYFYNTTIEEIISDIVKSKASFVRINEAGDLNNRQQVLKLKIIAERLKAHGITCYLYSKSTEYYEELKGSLIWNDSTGSIKGAKQYISIRPNKNGRRLKTPLNRVCQGNCSLCNTCRSEEITRTYCYYH